jgi:hypothetical protein
LDLNTTYNGGGDNTTARQTSAPVTKKMRDFLMRQFLTKARADENYQEKQTCIEYCFFHVLDNHLKARMNTVDTAAAHTGNEK